MCFHVAGLVDTRSGPFHDKRLHTVNVLGTENVIAACRRVGVARLVFTSSAAAVIPVTSSYGISKARSEASVLAANTPSFRTVALRPHVVYGPWDPLATDAALRDRIPPPGVGRGANRLAPIYVKNLARRLHHADRALQGVCVP